MFAGPTPRQRKLASVAESRCEAGAPARGAGAAPPPPCEWAAGAPMSAALARTGRVRVRYMGVGSEDGLAPSALRGGRIRRPGPTAYRPGDGSPVQLSNIVTTSIYGPPS